MTPQIVSFFTCISFHLEFEWVYRMKQKSNLFFPPTRPSRSLQKLILLHLKCCLYHIVSPDYIWFCFWTFFDPLSIFVLISHCFDQCSFQNISMFNMESLVISLLHLIFKNSLTILAQLLFHMKFRLDIFSSENPPCAL